MEDGEKQKRWLPPARHSALAAARESIENQILFSCFPGFLIHISRRLRANIQQITSPTIAPQMSIITSFPEAVRVGTND